ncbi:MAG: vitamin B12 dependent-methionine synthase activation domain-containing protein [Arhodomonas sp.]|nr:vitamin B12 dependent-methionine synthase activation domain-containing protein [Arhodomonas sp.]
MRPAPGYPACPDHTEKDLLWELLDAERNAGLDAHRVLRPWSRPRRSPAGYFSHPESRYFGLGRIDRDQVEDYARRKGMDPSTAERWLGPNLGYDPEEG